MADVGIGVPMSLDEVRKLVAGIDGMPDKTVEGHYGFKELDLRKFVAEMVKNLIIDDLISDTIDRHFRNCDAETRLKVFAFALAYLRWKNGYERK